MDGIEAIRAIRRRYPALPIVAISGGGNLNQDFLSAAKTFGAQRTLSKPFLPGDLLAAISEALQAA
jgi:two-component system chemotaxis response regulator CheY